MRYYRVDKSRDHEVEKKIDTHYKNVYLLFKWIACILTIVVYCAQRYKQIIYSTEVLNPIRKVLNLVKLRGDES